MPSLEQQEIALLKGHISRLNARLEFLYKHLGVTFVEDEHPDDDPNVIAAVKANDMLEAIRAYRKARGVGLEDAQAGIEEMRARLGI